MSDPSTTASHVVTTSEVPKILIDLGVADRIADIEVEPLTGGVSSAVFRAEIGETSVVVKQALPRLKVDKKWLSDPSRSAVECRAADYLSSILPGRVPAVLAQDGGRHLFVMESAPANSYTWKSEMLDGTFDLDVASSVGSLLGHIHETSSTDSSLPVEFASKKAFEELRLDAYIREVGRVQPKLASLTDWWVTRLQKAEICLVHADFSPKNLLVSPAREVLLLDHEVVHWGDPSFDLAFFVTHLLAKSLRSTEALDALTEVLEAYENAAPTMWQIVEGTSQLLGLMMMARIDGKSPLEYLTKSERDKLRRAAQRFIDDAPASLSDTPSFMRSSVQTQS